MRPRSCSLCGQPADVSALLLLSTLGVRNRRQQSAKAIPLCNACISVARESSVPVVGNSLTDALTLAWNALTRQSHEYSHPTEAHSPLLPSANVGQKPTN